jgi:glycerol-3-phosphate dehydrogenase (NAD(P)+)
MDKVAVIGAGSWGTTVATLTSAETAIWARRPELAERMRQQRVNPEYLPGVELPANIRPTSAMDEAVAGADLVVMAVPSHGFRDVFRELKPTLSADLVIVSLTKGIEQETLATMTQIVAEEFPGHDTGRTGVLTGPNLAAEVSAHHPAAAVVAMQDQEMAASVQRTFMGPTFRVYTNDDVIGCELGGALKNVMAIAAGMSDGLGFGDNTRATLITRALAELTRLGVALGGRPATFAGLAGMGDLIATCSSNRSRNHMVGQALARGQTLDEVVGEMRMVAEGIKTTRSVLDLAARSGIEMPIAEHVGKVLYEGMHPRDAVLSLMSREARPES